MNYIDLFHGIGGFALGAYWAGMKFENHFCSDIEPYCQKLYKLRFPESIQLGDITKIDTEELKKYGKDWIISGGFPCQDISIAGKGAGIHGDRSGLWFEYWRLIRDLRPRFAIMENVGMLVHRGLREVLGSLAEIGYDAEWQDIRASDVGAPHRRERIWIVAYSSSFRCHMRRFNRQGIQRENTTFNEIDSGSEAFSYSDRSTLTQEINGRGIDRCEGEEVGDESRTICENISHSEIERLQRERTEGEQITNSRREEKEPKRDSDGVGNYWSTEPDVGRVAHGIPSRVDRLKGLGNAIVPQIAEILFRQIKELI
jgi:DNA (cytosine-5)-methyltransferase 1